MRHYENIGLLTPEYISPDSGYRYYGSEQFEVLNTIRYLRALDMPLSEIEDFLKNKDIELIKEKLFQQKQIILKKQQELKRIEQKIDHRLNSLLDVENTLLDTVSLIQLPPCRVVWVDNLMKVDSSLDMEASIRKLDQSDAEAVVFLGKVGLGISIEHLQKSETTKYDGIFLILDQEDVYTGETLTLPDTLCVRLRFRGSHTDSPEHYKKLLRYIKKHKMQIVGFSREVTLIDYGITNNRLYTF
ncbi:MerR family transcriptional regulator [Enterococcus hirae]|nr:MerR family transcriptional regulator [Enterococcus hirae]EMF0066137.1 MerR family transcriptional regulator [Enterococcus hirae]EMF0139910.1 MerR family transcriptional regulator [Enterococcus hirae]EMF0152712.1 MerR family transcriptional regulator [Enterococcus hirae]EMF0187977.1 MerR family transcriptional regulator [Enterococcus hirae]